VSLKSSEAAALSEREWDAIIVGAMPLAAFCVSSPASAPHSSPARLDHDHRHHRLFSGHSSPPQPFSSSYCHLGAVAHADADMQAAVTMDSWLQHTSPRLDSSRSSSNAAICVRHSAFNLIPLARAPLTLLVNAQSVAQR
jgi:hypothetical protein